MDNSFLIEPGEYWEKRLSKCLDLGSVGFQGIGKEYNSWLYKMREKVFNIIWAMIPLKANNVKCLDIGCGTGFYIDVLNRKKVNVLEGCDFTQAAVDQVSRKYPNCKIFKLDICIDKINLNCSDYDIITCFDVLFHIIEDTNYTLALNNIHKILKPDGFFIFSENFCKIRRERGHIIDRTKESIISEILKNGFKIEMVMPTFIFMNPPMGSTNQILWALSNLRVSLLKWLNKKGLGIFGHLPGLVLYIIDSLLMKMGIKGFGTSIILARKILIVISYLIIMFFTEH